eukprot:1075963-Rhodomonas_salina.1
MIRIFSSSILLRKGVFTESVERLMFLSVPTGGIPGTFQIAVLVLVLQCSSDSESDINNNKALITVSTGYPATSSTLTVVRETPVSLSAMGFNNAFTVSAPPPSKRQQKPLSKLRSTKQIISAFCSSQRVRCNLS